MIKMSIFEKKTSDLINELQKERGVSSVFIVSNGREFSKELFLQKILTDQKISLFRKNAQALLFEDTDRDFKKNLSSILKDLENLMEQREVILKLNASKNDVFDSYTNTINNLLETVSILALMTKDSEIVNEVSIYLAFLRAKEAAGQERAIGARILLKEPFPEDDYRKYLSLYPQEQAFLKTFYTYAPADLRRDFDELMLMPELKKVTAYREIISKGGLTGDFQGLKAEEWFYAATASIEKMHVLEDKLSKHFMDTALILKTQAVNYLIKMSALILMLLIAVSLISYRLAQGLIKPINTVTKCLIKLSAGDTKFETPLKGRLDEIGQMAGTLDDFKKNIDERILTNEKLDKALSQAQVATKAKSNFLANMTHELRTPMNGVIGMANLLSGSELNNEQRKQIDIISGCANSLLTVINDILDFSKIESGKMDVESIPFNLKKMCEESIELVRFQAEGKDLKLEVEFHNSVPDYIENDPNRLRQIILNFLSNAIKFTMVGHVKLILSCPEKSSNDQSKASLIRFAIEDTGIGISKSAADILFLPFSQADSSTSRNFGGTGLGLSISRRLAELMGGKVWMKSFEGTGSTFYLEVPYKQVSKSEIKKLEERSKNTKESLDHRALRILLAEDNQINQMVALSVLKKLGYSAEIANNGLEVLEMLNHKKYDLIFMDMMMPEMDGLKATQEICKRFKSNFYKDTQKPRIIAMTANAMAEDREQCLKSGMDDFMTKPIILSELKKKILATPQIVKEDSEAIPEPPPSTQSSLEPSVSNAVVTFKSTRFKSQKVLESFEEDEDLIPDMIDLFLKTSLGYMENIKNAIESQNASELKIQSHTLKGSVKVFYADHSIEISQALEDIGHNKKFEDAANLYNDLEKELPLLQEELEEFKKKLA